MGIIFISILVIAVVIVGGLGGFALATDKTATLQQRCRGGLSCFVIIGILLTLLTFYQFGPRNTTVILFLLYGLEYFLLRGSLRPVVWTALAGHLICAAIFFAIAYYYGWLESYVLVDETGVTHRYNFTDWHGLLGILAVRVLVVHWFYLESAKK